MKLRKFAALAGAMVLTLGVAGTVYADSGSPTSINADVNGMTVTVSGNWTWEDASCNDSSVKIVGWAVDWGVPGYTDNPVPKSGGGNYYMGDSVQGNTVTTDGQLCKDFPGPWGPLSHTYAEPGEYDICVIIYDLRAGVTSGNHSNQAGGADRNKDNSVEENFLEGQEVCAGTSIVVEKVPEIRVLKLPKNQIVPVGGGDATFVYSVTNPGEVPLTDVTLVDDKCSPVTGPTGDTNGDSILDLDETWLYGCTTFISEDTTNTATATGHDGETTVTDTDTADVIVTSQQGSVGGETDTPTGPPTDTLTSTTTDAGGALPLLLLVLGVIGVGAVVLTPRRNRR